MTAKTRKPATAANTKPLTALSRTIHQTLIQLDTLSRSPLNKFIPPIPDALTLQLRLFHMRLQGMIDSRFEPVPTDEQMTRFDEFIDDHPRLHFDDDLIA